jgi:hypothetical protein
VLSIAKIVGLDLQLLAAPEAEVAALLALEAELRMQERVCRCGMASRCRL